MKKLRLVALVAALMIPMTACGSSDDSSDGAWKFTDDRGTKISLDSAPKRIVAQSSVAAALTDLGLGDRIVGVFGPLKGPDGKPDAQAAGLDASKVKDLTGKGEYGDVDVEEMAKLKPDLVITSTYLKPQLWYVNEATEKKIKKAYDIAVISFENRTLPQIFDSTERIATALGADKGDYSEGREAFEASGEKLQAAAKKAGNPTFQAVSPAQDVLYVSNPDANADLKYYRDELGLDIITPKKSQLDQGGYWRKLSWEKADAYPNADIAIWDARGGAAALKSLKAQPVWEKTKAAKDNAYIPWNSVTPPSPAAYARVIDDFTKGLQKIDR